MVSLDISLNFINLLVSLQILFSVVFFLLSSAFSLQYGPLFYICLISDHQPLYCALLWKLDFNLTWSYLFYAALFFYLNCFIITPSPASEIRPLIILNLQIGIPGRLILSWINATVTGQNNPFSLSHKNCV